MANAPGPTSDFGMLLSIGIAIVVTVIYGIAHYKVLMAIVPANRKDTRVSDVKVGKLITDEEGARDAIHVAVLPVCAETSLVPGQHVGFTGEKVDGVREVGPVADGPRGLQNRRGIGIVDPYLTVAIRKGARFYCFLYPGSVSGMRHHWAHPDIDDSVADAPVSNAPDADRIEVARTSAVSDRWLRDYAIEIGISYATLMQAGRDYVRDGKSYCLHFDTPDCVWSKGKEFWQHFQAVTGLELKTEEEYAPFRCAC